MAFRMLFDVILLIVICGYTSGNAITSKINILIIHSRISSMRTVNDNQSAHPCLLTCISDKKIDTVPWEATRLHITKTRLFKYI